MSIRCYRNPESFDYDVINQKLEFDILLLDIELRKGKWNRSCFKSE